MINYYDKVRIYMKTLYVLYLINIIVSFAGFAVGIKYFYTKKHYQRNVEMHLAKLTTYDELLKDLILVSQFQYDAYYGRRYRDDLKDKLKYIEDYRSLNDRLQQEGAKISQETITILLNRIEKDKAIQKQEIKALSHKIGEISFELMIIGIGVFVIGILLPLIIGVLIKKAIRKAKSELELQISRWVMEWTSSLKANGDKPFQSPNYWLNLILMTVELIAGQLKHPLAKHAATYAFLIRNELNKLQ